MACKRSPVQIRYSPHIKGTEALDYQGLFCFRSTGTHSTNLAGNLKIGRNLAGSIMKGNKKAKGSVAITEDRSRIRLRWSYLSKRYSLNHSFSSQVNMLSAKKLALLIEQDIALGVFDVGLEKYTGKRSSEHAKSASFTEQFEHWVRNYKQMDCDLHTNYNSTRNMIRKWGRVDASTVVRRLNAEVSAPVTYNRRLTILRTFGDWLVEQKVWEKNPLASVQRKRIKNVKDPKREPFTENEISSILEAFRSNAACSKFSNTRHDHYYPFMYFLFKTGVRNAEAVGLRVKHVDVGKKIISIKEVMARQLNNSSGANRIRKSTKNEKERTLPLTKDLENVLTPLIAKKEPDGLVFISPTGKPINDENFRKRIFTKVLDSLNIRTRVLYACRHTFGSRCIDHGITPVMTAFLMGNNPETALRRYTHQLSIPESLPLI